jgi:hypothetical protein
MEDDATAVVIVRKKDSNSNITSEIQLKPKENIVN